MQPHMPQLYTASLIQYQDAVGKLTIKVAHQAKNDWLIFCHWKDIIIQAIKKILNHYLINRNYCKDILKGTGISFYWNVENSLEFIDNILDIKRAHSIKTFDFPTLYIPLDIIYESLRSFIITCMLTANPSLLWFIHTGKKTF